MGHWLDASPPPKALGYLRRGRKGGAPRGVTGPGGRLSLGRVGTPPKLDFYCLRFAVAVDAERHLRARILLVDHVEQLLMRADLGAVSLDDDVSADDPGRALDQLLVGAPSQSRPL